MKKFVLVALATLVLCAASTAVWLNYPSVKEPAYIDGIITAVLTQRTALQEIAKDPEQNGYHSKTFLPWWGRDGIDNDPKTPIAQHLTDWALQYSSLANDSKVDHAQLLASRDGEFISKYPRVKGYLPELMEAFNKPAFVAPEESIGFDTVVLNFVAVRTCAQILSSEAEIQAAKGAPEQSIAPLKAVLNLGHKFASQGPMVESAMGLAVLNIGVESTLVVFKPTSKLTPEQWTELSNHLWKTLLPLDHHSTVVKREFAYSVVSLESVKDFELEGLTALIGDLVLPGFLRREARIYKNLMTKVFKRMEAGTKPAILESEIEVSFVRGFTGESGFLAAIMIPNFEGIGRQIHLTRRRQVLAASAAGLLAYRAKHNKFPEKLEDLSEVGILVPEGFDWSQQGLAYKPGAPTSLSVTLDPEPATEFDNKCKLLDQTKLGWYSYNAGTMTLDLGF